MKVSNTLHVFAVFIFLLEISELESSEKCRVSFVLEPV